MPRWARFLSCALTGVLLTLTGFLLVAYLVEGGPRFGTGLMDFLTTPAFRYLVGLFTLIAGAGLIVARLAANLTGIAGPIAGFWSGGVLALVYALFLMAGVSAQSGGFIAGLVRFWPAWALFAVPFALSGTITGWLWERLD